MHADQPPGMPHTVHGAAGAKRGGHKPAQARLACARLASPPQPYGVRASPVAEPHATPEAAAQRRQPDACTPSRRCRQAGRQAHPLAGGQQALQHTRWLCGWCDGVAGMAVRATAASRSQASAAGSSTPPVHTLARLWHGKVGSACPATLAGPDVGGPLSCDIPQQAQRHRSLTWPPAAVGVQVGIHVAGQGGYGGAQLRMPARERRTHWLEMPGSEAGRAARASRACYVAGAPGWPPHALVRPGLS